MSVYGTQLSYQFGRPITSRVSWPPENASAGASYSFVRRDGSEISEAKSGMYGLFRLLDQANVNTVSRSKVEVTFNKETYKAMYELTGEGRTDPMLVSKLTQFSCLTAL